MLATMRPAAGFLMHLGRAQQRRVVSALRAEAATDAAAATTKSFPFSAMDVRVGTFVSAREHPDSDKLFIEDIDVGEEEPRQIVSGLRAYYQLSDLESVRCLVVCNLRKAKLAGVDSFGMVLCGSENDNAKVEFIVPPADAENGDRVLAGDDDDGAPMTPNQVKKKKVWPVVQPKLAVVNGVAAFDGVALKAGESQGTCGPATIKDGPIY